METKETGTPMTPQRRAEWVKEKIAEGGERAATGADIALHGVAKGLIDEGILDEQEAHRFVAEAMINELLDHGFELVIEPGGIARVVPERVPLDWG